jgi:hypothetical protein
MVAAVLVNHRSASRPHRQSKRIGALNTIRIRTWWARGSVTRMTSVQPATSPVDQFVAIRSKPSNNDIGHIGSRSASST